MCALHSIDDSLATAEEAGLVYVTDEQPGIRRVRRGRGFSYHTPDDAVIRDRGERARLESIAIPPAWTDVWICPDPRGHILATGRDAKGRKQYRYHPRWREVRDADKFDRLPTFGRALPELRTRVTHDLTLAGLQREKVIAAVVLLLDCTLIRVGNEEYAVDNESYGLTTITSDHVGVRGEEVRFRFRGKGGTDWDAGLRDERLAEVVRGCEELPGQDLFQFVDDDGGVVDVTSTDVNAYLRETACDDFTAKDFRTWGGTVVAAETLAELGPADTERDAEKRVLEAIDAAAERLGNTRGVARASYVHPKVPDAYRDGQLHDIWRTARSTGGLRRGERAVLRVLEL